jgi:hypothetical protein
MNLRALCTIFSPESTQQSFQYHPWAEVLNEPIRGPKPVYLPHTVMEFLCEPEPLPLGLMSRATPFRRRTDLGQRRGRGWAVGRGGAIDPQAIEAGDLASQGARLTMRKGEQ